jgi:hypothetical protein
MVGGDQRPQAKERKIMPRDKGYGSNVPGEGWEKDEAINSLTRYIVGSWSPELQNSDERYRVHGLLTDLVLAVRFQASGYRPTKKRKPDMDDFPMPDRAHGHRSPGGVSEREKDEAINTLTRWIVDSWGPELQTPHERNKVHNLLIDFMLAVIEYPNNYARPKRER